jgi:hypothetical protein
MALRNPPQATLVVPLNSTTTGSAVAPAAVTEWPGISRRHRVDLTGFHQARFCCRISSPWGGAAAKVALQYSTDEAAWFYLAGTASGSAPAAGEYIAGNAAGTLVSQWVNLPAAARGDVVIRGVTLDGDNTTNGAGGTLALHART